MASTKNYDYNFPYFPPTPPHNSPYPPKTPPSHNPPTPPKVAPPSHSIPPPSPIVKPPPHPINPPPPPHIVPTPPPPPGHHSTVIVVIFVSLGGLFFLAFLAVALCCFIKKKKKKIVQETDVVKIDEHLKIQEAIIPGPHGPQTVILSVEEDVHIQEEIKKNIVTVGTGGSHIRSVEDHPQVLDLEASTSGPDHHHLEHKTG